MDKFTVIDGGKSETPGQTHSLPEGFKPASHATRHAGAIPCISPDGVPGEIIEVRPGDMPPELALLLLMAMMGRVQRDN